MACGVALLFLLVAGLQRMDYADNDQGPNSSAQHGIPREICKAPRKRSGQIHRGKPPLFFAGRFNIETRQFPVIDV